MCLICSQNKTLQMLTLSNQIGDAGAGSIGGALAYVKSRHPILSYFDLSFFFHTFSAHNPILFGLTIGHYQGVFLFVCQPKHVSDSIDARMEQNWRCRSLWPWCWPCVRLILSLRMNVRSHATPLILFGFILDIVKVCLCPICSQNNTLTELWLVGNQIGDVGAASIGDALAYVQSRHPNIFCF